VPDGRLHEIHELFVWGDFMKSMSSKKEQKGTLHEINEVFGDVISKNDQKLAAEIPRFAAGIPRLAAELPGSHFLVKNVWDFILFTAI